MTVAYETNCELMDIAERLGAAERVLLTTHGKPDGDALGSVVALGRALEIAGKVVERRVIPPVPPALGGVFEGVSVVTHDGPDAVVGEFDAVVVVDTGAWSQLDALRPWLEQQHERVIVIDHHLHGDDVGAMKWIDPTAAAACEIVADVIDAMGVAFDELIVRALFIGVASDTGWFRFSNCTSRTHELAARLHAEGVDHAALYAATEQGERPEKLALMVRALDSLQLVAGGRAAVMCLRVEDFKATGARPDETERFVDVPQMVREVGVVAMVVEQREGPTRVSLRSKPGEGAVDVNALARELGGGGHARAAGAKVDAGLDETVARLIGAIEGAL